MARATRKRARGKKAPRKGAKGRGGRKPGKWELVEPEDILRYRKENNLSRAKLAAKLHVSTTSIQNWETGRVASRKIQERLRALMDGRPVPSAGPEGEGADGREAAITTTGAIVSAYLRTHKGMKPDQLMDLIRSVKQALTN